MRILLSLFVLFLALPVQAQENDAFKSWLYAFQAEARGQGVSEATINQVFSQIVFKPRVIELDRKQPEGTMTFAQYKNRVISQARIDQGRRMYREHRIALERAAQKYGVPAPYIVALWGIETSYGNNTGGFHVPSALATLAYDGRRSEFFKKELLNALKIVDEGHISGSGMKGSWAGAMGQNQFMPSSFHAFAVDGNGDGKRDIWGSLPDVFASTANYLHRSGWKEDQRWGRRVKLPAEFSKNLIGLDHKKPLSVWAGMGVTQPDGSPVPNVEGMQASVVAPDGITGPAFLVYDNYRVIMKWNKSTYFATSVGLLADYISG